MQPKRKRKPTHSGTSFGGGGGQRRLLRGGGVYFEVWVIGPGMLKVWFVRGKGHKQKLMWVFSKYMPGTVLGSEVRPAEWYRKCSQTLQVGHEFPGDTALLPFVCWVLPQFISAHSFTEKIMNIWLIKMAPPYPPSRTPILECSHVSHSTSKVPTGPGKSLDSRQQTKGRK